MVSFLRPFVPRARGAIWLIVAASVLLATLGLAPAALTRQVVDSVLPHRDLGALVLVGAGMAALTAGNALTGFARAQALLLLENRIDAAMMSGFLRHLLSLPYAYFQLRSGGDLLVRAASTSVMRDLLTAQSLGILLDGGLVVIYLGVLAALVQRGIEQGWVCGTPSPAETPGLMIGLAGIGYNLLRFADPAAVPSLLLAEPPRPAAGLL